MTLRQLEEVTAAAQAANPPPPPMPEVIGDLKQIVNNLADATSPPLAAQEARVAAAEAAALLALLVQRLDRIEAAERAHADNVRDLLSMAREDAAGAAAKIDAISAATRRAARGP